MSEQALMAIVMLAAIFIAAWMGWKAGGGGDG